MVTPCKFKMFSGEYFLQKEKLQSCPEILFRGWGVVRRQTDKQASQSHMRSLQISAHATEQESPELKSGRCFDQFSCCLGLLHWNTGILVTMQFELSDIWSCLSAHPRSAIYTVRCLFKLDVKRTWSSHTPDTNAAKIPVDARIALWTAPWSLKSESVKSAKWIRDNFQFALGRHIGLPGTATPEFLCSLLSGVLHTDHNSDASSSLTAAWHNSFTVNFLRVPHQHSSFLRTVCQLLYFCPNFKWVDCHVSFETSTIAHTSTSKRKKEIWKEQEIKEASYVFWKPAKQHQWKEKKNLATSNHWILSKMLEVIMARKGKKQLHINATATV